jgi:predicted nucleic acid-binding protein
MNITHLLPTITRLFLDTAPIIYYVEKNPQFFSVVKPFFDQIDSGSIVAVTSPITLAESLIVPIRLGQTKLSQDYQTLIRHGYNTQFVTITDIIGLTTAQLRVKYNLTLPDALQLAVAIESNCDTFLTNDLRLKRVSELQVVVLKDLYI